MTGWQQATPQQNPTFPPIQPGRRRGRSEPGQQAYRITGSRTGRERSCYLVKLTKLYTKKGLPPDAEKSRTKKVSVCCPESGISDTLKESPAAGECRRGWACRRILQNARKCARKKNPATCLEILEALKGDAPPDQGVIRADRACLMLNCCKKWR